MCILGYVLLGFIGVSSSKLVDLSYSYDPDIMYWYDSGEPFKVTKEVATDGEDGKSWYASNVFKTSEHSGTHLDAPYHFYKEGRKVAQIPLERLVNVKGVLIDVSKDVGNNTDYTLPVQKLDSWVSEHGPLSERTVVLLKYGWHARHKNRTLYMGSATPPYSFPGLSEEAVQWIVDNGKVVGVGTDAASIDSGSSKTLPAHRILTKNDIYILENVAINENLPPTFDLLVLPMKIRNGTGAPCRVVAILK